MKDLILKSNNIAITKESDSIYYLKYDSADSLPPPVFTIKSKSTGEQIGIYLFKVDYQIPLPAPVINYKLKESGSEVLPEKLTTLLLLPGLEDEYNRKLLFEIVSFKTTIVHKGNPVYSQFSKGNKFNKKANDYYFKCVRGDSLIISNVTLKAPNGKLYAVRDHAIQL